MPPADAQIAQDKTAELAEEVPVGFRYGGVPYGVMMATPADFEDFALGFSITEGIATAAADLRAVSVAPREDGFEIDITLTAARFQAMLGRERSRSLRGHTSCGVCGVRDLADVPGWTNCVAPAEPPETALIRRAVRDLRGLQPLGLRTNATHAAAWVTRDGIIRDVREDVGRHNALDKLIGAFLRAGYEAADGFCLVTSRCSFEMVQKSVAAGFSVLVAISAPTALAVRTAEEAGLMLVTRAGKL
jgi:FdhD protein